MLLITNMFPSLLWSSQGELYKSTKNTIICHTEYQEPLNVIINESNIEQFHLHTLAVYCILSTLPAPHGSDTNRPSALPQ